MSKIDELKQTFAECSDALFQAVEHQLKCVEAERKAREEVSIAVAMREGARVALNKEIAKQHKRKPARGR